MGKCREAAADGQRPGPRLLTVRRRTEDVHSSDQRSYSGTFRGGLRICRPHGRWAQGSSFCSFQGPLCSFRSVQSPAPRFWANTQVKVRLFRENICQGPNTRPSVSTTSDYNYSHSTSVYTVWTPNYTELFSGSKIMNVTNSSFGTETQSKYPSTMSSKSKSRNRDPEYSVWPRTRTRSPRPGRWHGGLRTSRPRPAEWEINLGTLERGV